MRATFIYCLLSCLAASTLAVRHPYHKHRHDREKRTEVLIVEEDLTVVDIEETIYLPGPPPEDHEDDQGGKNKEHGHKECPLTTSTLADGSTTVITGPKPTDKGFGTGAGKGKAYVASPKPQTAVVGSGAGEATPSKSTTTSPADAGDSESGSDSRLLSGGDASLGSVSHSTDSSVRPKSSDAGDATTPAEKSADSASTAPSLPTTTTPSASSVLPANHSPTASAAVPSHSGAYPFSALVAFGDNLSDNGNGSYAHNVTAVNATHVYPGNKVYGAGTWTNDQVAVSYLTDLLGVPMAQNFAFGHAWGGANFGATIDDTLQQSNFSASLADGPWFQRGEFAEPCWGAPSAKVQVDGYVASGVNTHALHFFWIGANDMNAVQTLKPDDASVNAAFAANIATKITNLVSKLLDSGAPYVLVANLYPKHLAPQWYNYLGMNTADKVAALGAAISAANVALETALKALPTANRIIYYDAFTFMSNLYANPGDSFPNIKDTNGWPSFCDGDSEETEMVKASSGTTVDGVKVNDNWDYCVWLKHQDEWFWMQYVDPTSHVHRLVAQDMERTVKAFPFP